MSLAADRAELLALLTRLSFARREVVLSSGKKSDFYIDCKKTVLTARGHLLVGRLMLDCIRTRYPEAKGAGGLTLGADPLASAVALTSALGGAPLHAFIVRKEAKGHGTGQWMEGRTNFQDGDAVAIVEDVVTTGASTLKAIERTEAEGLKVAGVVTLVDRLEGGSEVVIARGYRLEALFTRKDFIPDA